MTGFVLKNPPDGGRVGSRLEGLFPLLLLCLLAALSATCGDGGKSGFTLTVLHSNDGESKLIDETSGIARFATVVKNLKDEVGWAGGVGKGGVVLLSSGDNFLAGPELNASLEDGTTIFDAEALKLIGYDALCIGNHEFDFGPDFLARFIAAFGGASPFLSANLDFSGEKALSSLVDKGAIAPSAVLDVSGKKVGVIGATTPSIKFISVPGRVRVDADVAVAVQKEIDSLTDRGVGIIIVLSHLQSVSEDLDLVGRLRGADLVIAGGGNELLANDGDPLHPLDAEDDIFGPYPLMQKDADGADVPIVTTEGGYRYVGRIILHFDGRGKLLFVDPASNPVRVVGGNEEDAVVGHPAVAAQVEDPVRESVAALGSNVIARSETALDGKRTAVRTRETNLGNLAADALLDTARRTQDSGLGARAVVSFLNGGGIRNDSIIPAGDVTELHTFSVLPFPNLLTIVPGVTPSRVKELLENAVSKVERRSGRFAQVAGLRFTYDPGATAQVTDAEGNIATPGSRIIHVEIDSGEILVSNGMVNETASDIDIVTTNFLAGGGDQYPLADTEFRVLGISYQQALFHFITETLGGMISASDYPPGGEGRITTLR